MQQTKAVALSFLSISNKSKQKHAGLSGHVQWQCPERVRVCVFSYFFSFMMCFMPQNCLIKSLREDQTKSSVDIFWRRISWLVGSEIVALKKLDLALQRLALTLRCVFFGRWTTACIKAAVLFFSSPSFSLSLSSLLLLLLHCQNAVTFKHKDRSCRRCGNLPQL